MAEQVYENVVSKLEERSKYMDRLKDKGIVNKTTGSAIGLRESGEAIIAAGEEAQYKINPDTKSSIELTFQSTTLTNRKNILTDELIINKHKMNPQLTELTDFKNVNNNAIGNLTMLGTVLVKVFEPHMKKYVLMRRLIRTPLFSNKLNTPDIPSDMNIVSDISDVINKATEATTATDQEE